MSQIRVSRSPFSLKKSLMTTAIVRESVKHMIFHEYM